MVDETTWAITNAPTTFESLMDEYEAFEGFLQEICLGIL